MKRFFRITYTIGVILLFVLVTAAGITQTRWFKASLRDYLLEHAGTVLHGELTLGRIDGNLITGLEIDGVRLRFANEDVLDAERVEVQYDPFGIPFNRIGISRLVLDHPVIRVIHGTDGSWNVDRMFVKTAPDSAPSKTVIALKSVEIRGGRVFFVDSLRLANRQAEGDTLLLPERVDYARIRLDSLNLSASATIAPGNVAASITRASFRSPSPDIDVRLLKCDATLTRTLAAVKDLEIRTSRTHLRVSASLKEVDLASLRSIAQLGPKPVEVDIDADPLDTRELRRFLFPWVDFLDGRVAIRGEIRGTFADLRVRQLAVEMGGTRAQLEGTLQHLDRPRDLTMDIGVVRSGIHPPDLREYLPGLELPDLDALGDVLFDARYSGRPAEFFASVDATCAAGDVSTEGTLRFDKGEMTYDMTVKTRDANIAVIPGMDRWASKLNAVLKVNGQGLSPRTMFATGRLEIDSSVVGNLPVRRTVFVVDAADGTIRSHGTLMAGSTRMNLTGTMRVGAGGVAAYDFETLVNSMDLAELLEDNDYDSELGFTLRGRGYGRGPVRWDSLALDMSESRFREEVFASAMGRATFRSTDSTHQQFLLTSDVLDASVEGEFALRSLPGFLSGSVDMIVRGVRERIAALDSIRTSRKTETVIPARRKTGTGAPDRIDAGFTLDLHDAHPIGSLLLTVLEGEGQARGTVRGTSGHLALDAKVTLPRFTVGDSPVSIVDGNAECSLSDITQDSTIERMNGRIKANARLVSAGVSTFSTPAFVGDMRKGTLSFTAAGFVDSLVQVRMEGAATFRDRLLSVVLDTVTTAADEVVFAAPRRSQVRFGSDGIAFDSLRLEHENEAIGVSGVLDPAGKSDIAITLEKFRLSNLPSLFRRSASFSLVRTYTGVVGANAGLRGTFEDPEVTLTLNADDVRLEGATLGHIASRLAYAKHRMEMSVRLDGTPGSDDRDPELLLTGSTPFNLTFVSAPDHPLDGTIDLWLRSSGLNMSILEPFIPEISGLTGSLACDMKMKGTVVAPEYEGSLDIREAQFLFQPVGIRYRLNGRLRAAGDRLNLENVVVRNLADDEPDGAMNVVGSLSFAGLSFRGFDLVANGQLLVMKEESRRPDQKFYGRLFVAPGRGGLHWQGDFKHSLLRGDLGIREAQLTFPPDREADERRVRTIPVVFVDDTLRVIPGRSRGSIRRKSTGRTAGILESGTESAKLGFVDRIDFDLGLEMQGPTQLRMVFNTQTSEELYADLQGRAYFFKTPSVTRLTGTVEASDRSYYNFIKKFKVSEGQLLFTGDPLNPELNITATYEGVHQRDSLSLAQSGLSPSQAGREEKVTVVLKITGTRKEPKPKFGIEIDGKERQTGDEESDAISFILGGQFRNELTDQQRSGLLGANLGIGLASGMLTGPLSDLLRRETGVIQSVDVLYYGGGSFDQSADVRLTGQVGDAVIRLGGRVLNNLSNTNASVEVPLSSITSSQSLRNFILTLERRVEGTEGIEDTRRTSNGARIYYRLSF